MRPGPECSGSASGYWAYLPGLRVIILLLILGVLTGCPVRPPGLPDKGRCTRLSDEEKAEVLSQVRDYSYQIGTLRALLAGSVKQGLTESAFTQTVVFKRPDRLRLEFFATSLHRLTALIVARDGELQAIDPQSVTVYRGKATVFTFERLLTVPLVPEEMMMWLTGRFPLPGEEQCASCKVFACPDSNRVHLEFRLPDKRIVTLVVNLLSGAGEGIGEQASGEQPEDMILAPLEFMEVRNAEGEKQLFSRFVYEALPDTGIQAAQIPSEIAFWLPEAKIEGSLVYQQSKVNQDLGRRADRLFSLRIPIGAEVVDIDADGARRIGPFLR